MNNKNQYSDYAQYLLAYYCMPTLLEMKPSSMISIKKEVCDSLILIQELEEQIRIFHCHLYILYENKKMINLLIYNGRLVNCLLSCEAVNSFFINHGYYFVNPSVMDILGTFKIKITKYHSSVKDQNHNCFPHEIGVLFGYPIEDVEDFIQNQGKNYLCCGCWKVYHNKDKAMQIFQSYRKVQRYALDMLNRGMELKEIDKMLQ